MKRFLVRAMVICGLLAFAMPAWSLTIDAGGTDVGVLDFFMGAADLDNSGGAEDAWVESLVPGATWSELPGSDYTWVNVDGSATIKAAALQDEPLYYFLKTNSNPGELDHFMFQNLDELAFAVINFALYPDIENVGAISHVGESGGGTSVPEPGTLMLLGSGLVGLALYGRKTFKR